MVDPHELRTPRYTVASASAEKELPWNFFGRVDLTSRDGSRGFAFDQFHRHPELNEYLADNSRYTDTAPRRSLCGGLSRPKYQWFGSYTRSRATSDAAVQYTIENPFLTPQSGGPQPWDAPNRFLMWGWAPVDQTGSPVSAPRRRRHRFPAAGRIPYRLPVQRYDGERLSGRPPNCSDSPITFP